MADPLPDIPVGISLVVTDPADNSLKELSGYGLPIVDMSGAKMRDGSTANPIVLNALSQLSAVAGFPFVLVQNSAGRLLALPAQSDGTARFLQSLNGQWKAVPLPAVTCFDYDSICACPPDYVAGFMFNDAGQLCLVRLDPSDLGGADHFTNTNTTTITGNGTSGSPYGVNVKISAVAGNRIQILADGLYVGPDY